MAERTSFSTHSWTLRTPKLRKPLARVAVRAGAAGPRAYVVGGMDVWEYVMVARDCGWNPQEVAEVLEEPLPRVEAALRYYHDHPQEIEARLQQMDAAASDPRATF